MPLSSLGCFGGFSFSGEIFRVGGCTGGWGFVDTGGGIISPLLDFDLMIRRGLTSVLSFLALPRIFSAEVDGRAGEIRSFVASTPLGSLRFGEGMGR